MPKIIKRYQNRKLYDTEDSCYVTLEDICDMIKQGEDVQVIDNTTKEDLTSVTLAQIILEEERKTKGVLPLNIFKQIIQSSGEVIKEFVHKSLESGKEFVDKQIKPTVESVQSIPTVAQDIKNLKTKIDGLERKLKDYQEKK